MTCVCPGNDPPPAKPSPPVSVEGFVDWRNLGQPSQPTKIRHCWHPIRGPNGRWRVHPP
jgi:hypothetical protein